MSKPDDIPQDVWDAAAVGIDYLSRRQEHVARAILAERERCAATIEDRANEAERSAMAILEDREEPDAELLLYAQLLRQVAAAIRGGTAPTIKPWSGGECPEDAYSQVKPVYRGPARPQGIRITCAPAGRLDWSHDGGPDDIVGYEVLLDRRPA